jgi:hypothetical protein
MMDRDGEIMDIGRSAPRLEAVPNLKIAQLSEKKCPT